MKWLKRKLRGWLIKDYLKDRVEILAIQQVVTDPSLMMVEQEYRARFLEETFREMTYKLADEMLKKGLIECERERDQRLMADVIRMKVRIFVPNPYKKPLENK